ncbi:hypothetical protein ACFLT9_05945 [Acidobacteriota bacterium]
MKSLTLLEQYVLLAVFHLNDTAYLKTIRNFVNEGTGKDLAIGTIYVPLERLYRLGFLSTNVGAPKPKVGGRSIKYYRLTGEGRKILEELKKIQDAMWLGFSRS